MQYLLCPYESVFNAPRRPRASYHQVSALVRATEIYNNTALRFGSPPVLAHCLGQPMLNNCQEIIQQVHDSHELVAICLRSSDISSFQCEKPIVLAWSIA